MTILLGIGIAIAVLIYCVFEIGNADILILEKLHSKLSRKNKNWKSQLGMNNREGYNEKNKRINTWKK